MKTIAALFIVLSIVFSTKAQDTTSIKIALLPIISNGIDLASVQTAESILRMELGKTNKLSVISEKKTFNALGNKDCTDEECAKEIGEKLNAKEVLLCKLNLLGEKIIVQYIF